jgi:hypothetical protein
MDRIRPIKASDYPALQLYWHMANEPCIPQDIYPLDRAFVFERNGSMLYCVAVWKPEGVPYCFCEGLIRNPHREADPSAVVALQAFIDNFAQELGCKAVLAIAKNKGLEKHHSRLGYNRVSDGALMAKGLGTKK